MNAEISASCPQCGQHYATDPTWRGRSLTCVVCHTQFIIAPARPLQEQPTPAAVPPPRSHAPPATPSTPPEGSLCQPFGTLCGLSTPMAALLITVLLRFLGPIGWLLAAVAIPYLSHHFASWYLLHYGRAAFEYYKKASRTAFLLLPAVGIAIFLSLADEAAGLLFVPVAFGAYLAAVLLAALWLAGAQWFGPNE